MHNILVTLKSTLMEYRIFSESCLVFVFTFELMYPCIMTFVVRSILSCVISLVTVSLTFGFIVVLRNNSTNLR